MADRDKGMTEDRARTLYRRAIEDLDPEARLRLARAREDAMGTGSRSARAGWWALAAAAAGLGAVGLALVLSAGGQPDFDHIAETDAGAAEIELFLVEDNLEMIADYDFYLWLDAEPDAG
jgi:TPR repeat protein